MKKKLFVLGLIAVMLFSFTACGGGDADGGSESGSGKPAVKKMTAKDLLRTAIENSMEVKSAEQDLHMDLALDVGENEDPNMQMMASMLQEVGLDLHSKMDSSGEIPNMQMTGSVKMSGMSYEFEMYMNQEKVAMKMPMNPKYLVSSVVDEEGQSMTLDQEKAKEITLKVMDIMLEQLSDDQITKEKDAEVTINEETVKVTKINIAMDDTQAKAFLKKAIKAVMTDESVRDMIVVQSQKQAKAFGGEEPTKEEILADLDESVKNIEEGWDEAVKLFTVNTLEMSYGIDSNTQIISSDGTVDVTVIPPVEEGQEESKPINAKVNFNATSSNINGDITIEFPELTEENSQDVSEMGGMGM